MDTLLTAPGNERVVAVVGVHLHLAWRQGRDGAIEEGRHEMPPRGRRAQHCICVWRGAAASKAKHHVQAVEQARAR